MAPVDASALPPEVSRALRGVVFDVDDTVTRDGRLEREAFDAMWRLHEAGLALVAVTGRPLGWADVVARHWPVALAVGENGAGWVWRADGLFREGYFHDAAERAAQQARLARIVARARAELPEIALASDHRARRCDVAFDVSEHARVPADRVTALAALVAHEGARALVSSVHLHVVAGAWNKADGVVRALADALGEPTGAPLDGWLFVGDSGNDADAFARFPVTVGVANVSAWLGALPVPPRWITRADRGRGFAELARVLLRGRSS